MTAIKPFGGFGLGLRRTHYDDFLVGNVSVDFVEVISENYMVDGGRQLRVLEQVRERLPVIIHGVSMSIGSAGGLDAEYLAKLKRLEQRIDPLWVSDHLCWTRNSAHNSHDLLPMPLTEEALAAVTSRAATILGVADRVGSLETGKDGDLLVLSGPPTATRTVPLAASPRPAASRHD